MKAFAHLLERLAFTAARNAKLRLLRHYLEATPDPDRGLALAALTATTPDAAEATALVAAFREVREAGAADRFLLAVAPELLDAAVPLVEAAPSRWA